MRNQPILLLCLLPSLRFFQALSSSYPTISMECPPIIDSLLKDMGIHSIIILPSNNRGVPRNTKFHSTMLQPLCCPLSGLKGILRDELATTKSASQYILFVIVVCVIIEDKS